MKLIGSYKKIIARMPILWTLFAIFLISLSLPMKVLSQAPGMFSYQAVIRDGNDNLIVNQGMGVKVSILQGSSHGMPVFVEKRSAESNANGLISINIGDAASVKLVGDISAINWSDGSYFIKTEIDPSMTGGINYTITSTSQLLSVPYALFSESARSFSGSVPFPGLRVSAAGDSVFFGEGQHLILPGASLANPDLVVEPPFPLAQRYVSLSGSNSNNGSAESPWRTVMYALSQVDPGTEINIAPGVYQENFVINHGTCPASALATPDSPIRLISTTLHGAVFQRPDASPNERTVSYTMGNSIEFYGIDFRGTQIGQNDAGPVWVQTNNVLNSDGNNYRDFIDDPKFIRCLFSGTGTDAIKLNRVRRAVIEGCIFKGNHPESGIDALVMMDCTIRYNTFSPEFSATDYVTFKAGSLGTNIIEHNDFNGTMKPGTGAAVYLGNATRAITMDHINTPFVHFECSNVIVRYNFFRGLGNVNHGVRFSGAIDCTVTGNVFDGNFTREIQLQQSLSVPTEFELTASEYNALSNLRKTHVFEQNGRYWVAHRTQGAVITNNVRIGSGDFALNSGINNITHNYWGVSPVNTMVIYPATRGTTISNNISLPAYIPEFPFGHEALPENL